MLANLTEDQAIREERDLFAGGPVAVLIWKLTENWPLLHASQNVQAIFGYDAETMTSENFRYADCIHPDDLERVAYEVEQNIADGLSTWEQRYRILLAGGEVHWLYDFTVLERDDSGQPSLLRGYVMDDTGRLGTEKELKTITEIAGDAIWINSPDGGYDYANPAALALTGHTLQEIRKLHIPDLAAPYERHRLEAHLELHQHQETVRSEWWLLR